MKKALVGGLLIAVLIVLLAGCMSGGVKNSQMKADIEALEEVQNCYSSRLGEESVYTVDELEVIKEQINKDDKQDLVFCNVTVKNGYFSVNFDLNLEYIYYDKGGWMLESFEMGEITAVPVALPEKETVQQFLDEELENTINAKYGGRSLKLENGALTVTKIDWFDVKKIDEESNNGCIWENATEELVSFVKENNIKVAKIEAEYASAVLTTNGYYYMVFADNAWKLSGELSTGNEEYQESLSYGYSFDDDYIVADYRADYSNAVGKYNLFSDFANMGCLTVEKVEGDKITLTLEYELQDIVLSVNGEDMRGQYYPTISTGEMTTVDFDDLEGKFAITSYYGKTEYARYNPYKNTWVTTCTGDEFSQTKDARVSIGFYSVDGGQWNPSWFEAYIDDELGGHPSVRVPYYGSDLTVKDALETWFSYRGIRENYEYSEDGKRLVQAYGEKENSTSWHWGKWICFINGVAMDIDDYLNAPINYGDRIELTYIQDNFISDMYYFVKYDEVTGLEYDDYMEAHGSMDSRIWNEIILYTKMCLVELL